MIIYRKTQKFDDKNRARTAKPKENTRDTGRRDKRRAGATEGRGRGTIDNGKRI